MRPVAIQQSRRKYHNIPTTVGGLRFDSKAEARRWSELLLLQRAGEIYDLRRQVPFVLHVCGVKIGRLILDFVYVETATQRVVYEDVKGGDATPLWKWKVKHFGAEYGRRVEIVR